MLKQRLIASIIVKDGFAVQSFGFRRFLPIGSPAIAAEHFNRWSADEIFLLDISASREQRGPDIDLIAAVAAHTFVPLTYAGGIRSVADAVTAIKGGADKVAVNTAALNNPTILRQLAERLGSQCVVAAIDARRDQDGAARAFGAGGTQASGQLVEDVARAGGALGAGEILVNSIDCDGARNGFDLQLLSDIAAAVDLPIIAMGGAGMPEHLVAALRLPGISAVAIGNLLHHTEHSLLTMRAAVLKAGIDLRHETYSDYRTHPIDDFGRLRMYPGEELSALQFSYHAAESI